MKKTGRLQVKNLGAIKQIDIPLTRSLVVFGGRNNQGKTTAAIHALACLLAGKKGIEGEALRDGETEGHVILDFADFEIVRMLAPRSKDWPISVRFKGAPQSKPQDRVNLLFGKLSFNASRFWTADQKTQAQMLLQAAGLDFSALDAKRKALYDARTQIGRDRDILKGALEAYDVAFDPPDAPVDTADLIHRLNEAQRINDANAAERREIEARKRIDARNQDSIERLRAELKALEETSSIHAKETARLAAIADALADVDTTEIEAKIANASSLNEQYRLGKQRAKHGEEYKAKESAYRAASAQIDQIDADKRAALQNAEKLPLRGRLEVTDDGITLDGRPVSRAAGRDRAKLTACLAAASVEPDFPLIGLDGLECFDEEGMADLAAELEALDVVSLGSRVGADDTCTFIMQDGTAVAVDEWLRQQEAK